MSFPNKCLESHRAYTILKDRGGGTMREERVFTGGRRNGISTREKAIRELVHLTRHTIGG